MDVPDPAENGQSPVTTESAASRSVSRRHLLMGIGLLSVGGLAYARQPKRQYPDITEARFDGLIPKSFGDWATNPVSDLVMPPEGELAEKLYQHIVTRTYTHKDGTEVMFLVAYNALQVNNVQLHRPEICYAASGFSIDLSQELTLDVGNGHAIPARTVRAERATRVENIVYWTRIGDEFPQTWTGQRIAMTKANLEGHYADGMLVRMSVLENDNGQSVSQLSRFVRDMAQHSNQAARYMLFRT